MRKLFNKIYYSVWKNSFFVALLIVVLWIFGGYIFGNDFFDKYFSLFKILNSKEESLTYASVLFAVQIPIFIKLLEVMTGSGYIRRVLLPSVVHFREVLISYVLISFLLLISPRNAFYYLPVLGLTILSAYIVFEAIRVMFERRKLRTREDRYLNKIIEQVYSKSLNGRFAINKFLEEIKKKPYVSHSLLDFSTGKNKFKIHEIKANESGTICEINLDGLNELMENMFYSNTQSPTNRGKVKAKSEDIYKYKVKLVVMPMVKVKYQDTLMQLILSEENEIPKKNFLKDLRSCIKIEYDHPDSAAKKFDDIIKDLRQDLREAIDKDDRVALEEPLEFYRSFLWGLACMTVANDSGYTFENARKEFHSFYGDSVSEKLETIADIFEEAFSHGVKEKKKEAVDHLINSMYGNVLEVTRKFNILTAAVTDNALVYSIGNLIYARKSSLKDIDFVEETFKALVFRFKEHTGLLLYNYRHHENIETCPEDKLFQWITSRINDTRGFMMSAYKESKFEMFKAVNGVFTKIEKDDDLYGEEIGAVSLLTRCNLFVMAAYFDGRSNETDAQKEAKKLVDNYLKKLSAQDLTAILVKCIDEGYAKKWRIDTYDLVADGRMHSVPDYDMKLKSLWMTYMLRSNNIPQDLSLYSDTPIDKTMTFSDGSLKPDDSYLLKRINDLEDQRNLSDLKTLITSFINERRKWEDDKLVKEPIDKNKIDKFRKEINKGYKERSLAYRLFRTARHLKFTDKADRDFRAIGWNQIQEKAGFINDWHIGYYHNGEERGREIANAENESILTELLSNPKTTESIDDWVQSIQSNDQGKWVLIGVNINDWSTRRLAGQYIDENNSNQKVYFKEVKQLKEVEFIFSNSIKRGLYAVKSDQIGTLNVKGSPKEPVSVSVDAYSHDSALLSEILKSSPAWLSKKGDQTDQENFLKTMVRLFIDHPFKYISPKNVQVLQYPIVDDYI